MSENEVQDIIDKAKWANPKTEEGKHKLEKADLAREILRLYKVANELRVGMSDIKQDVQRKLQGVIQDL